MSFSKHSWLESNLKSCQLNGLRPLTEFVFMFEHKWMHESVWNNFSDLYAYMRIMCMSVYAPVCVCVSEWVSVILRSVDGYQRVCIISISRLRPYHVCTITAPFTHFLSLSLLVDLPVDSCIIIHIKKDKTKEKLNIVRNWQTHQTHLYC